MDYLLQVDADADPDPADHVDADPDPAFQFDADQFGSGSSTLILRPVDELDHMLVHWAGHRLKFEFFTYTIHKLEKLIP